MRRPSIARLILLCSVALVGCEGTSNPELNVPDPTLDDLQVATNTQDGNPFLGAWRLESAVVGDDELVVPHDLFIAIFRSDGTLWASASNDTNHLFCEEPQTDCTFTTTYTYTKRDLLFDDGEDTEGYVFCGGRLILMDSGSDGQRLTFVRTRQDCYVQDCT